MRTRRPVQPVPSRSRPARRWQRLLAAAGLASGLGLAAPPAHADPRLVPVDLEARVDGLPASERAALARLVEAARVIDDLYLRQVWSGNGPLLLELAYAGSPLLADFLLYKGPWNRLDNDKPFVPGVGDKPAQGAFYPDDATKPEIEAWLKSLSPAERTVASGFYTVIRRRGGKLVSVPYSEEYGPELARAARLLDEAAALTGNASLKRFLSSRAAAFRTNDYRPSDAAWMELDSSVEPTIGPYEVYEDNWFNAKAAFEAFITVRDDVETKKLAKLSSVLQDLEDHLPEEPALRSKKLGAQAPIRVVNELFAAGDARHGVTTAAYNLPNDEELTRTRGTKRVMLKNVQEAKFERVLKPIAAVALASADRARIGFDAFFTHILMHELMHGLGPHAVRGFAGDTVRAKLEDAYSAIEEAKADITGLWAMHRLVDQGVLDKKLGETLYATYLASSFRSVRFGVNEAHGRGQAVQLNWLLDKGGVKVLPDGTFTVVPGRVRGAVEELARELLAIEGTGDRARAQKLLATGVIRPEVKRVLDKLGGVPVDIAPRFVTADQLARGGKP